MTSVGRQIFFFFFLILISRRQKNIGCILDCSIYSWGWNEHGNLGQNDTKNRSYPQELALPFERIHKV